MAGKLVAFQEEICSIEFACWLVKNNDSLRRSRSHTHTHTHTHTDTHTHTHTHTHTSCRNEIPLTAVTYILILNKFRDKDSNWTEQRVEEEKLKFAVRYSV